MITNLYLRHSFRSELTQFFTYGMFLNSRETKSQMPNEFFVVVAVVVLCVCTKTSLYQYESHVAFFFFLQNSLFILTKSKIQEKPKHWYLSLPLTFTEGKGSYEEDLKFSAFLRWQFQRTFSHFFLIHSHILYSSWAHP